MATQLQLRKGTKIQNDTFTGAQGELTFETDTKGLRIHDGATQGGFEVPVLVAVQRPTAANNYTWYRKYSDGWVEQGGRQTGNLSIDYGSEGNLGIINLPVPMADTNYTALATGNNYTYLMNIAQNTGNCKFTFGAYTASRTLTCVLWYICGMAA